MYTWPVPEWKIHYSFDERPRGFGCPRDGGKRKHAGCDLYAPEGSPVVSIWHGRVLAVYEFYGKADAIEIDHGTLGIVRYGEIIADDNIETGTIVKSGDKIGTVARLQLKGNIHPMLHFELYDGSGKGKLTQPGTSFKRRSDLVDPSLLLKRIWFSSF